jgi:hypothetical protein
MWPGYLAAEHVELVAEKEELDLLDLLGAQRQDDQLKETAQTPIEESEDNEMGLLWFHSRERIGRTTMPSLISTSFGPLRQQPRRSQLRSTRRHQQTLLVFLWRCRLLGLFRYYLLVRARLELIGVSSRFLLGRGIDLSARQSGGECSADDTAD